MSFSLGSMAGGLSQGITSEQQIALQKQAMANQQMGQGALGNALGGVMGGPPQNPLQSFLSKFSLGGQPPQPQAPSPGLPTGPQGAPGGGMGGQPMPAPPMQLQGAAPQPGQPQVAAQPQPPAQGGQGSPLPAGNIDLATIVQRIKQYNPNIKGPELAAAVERFTPLMNAQSQAQFRQIQMQLAPAKLAVEQQRADETGRHNVATEKAAGRRGDQADERIELSRKRIEAATAKSDAALQEKMREFEMSSSAKERQANYRSVQAAINAKLRASQEAINADNAMDPADKAKLQQQAQEDASLTQKQLDEVQLRARGPAGAEPTTKPTASAPTGDGPKDAARAPASAQAPPAPKPGDVQDGYRFKGGDPSKQESWEKI